MHTNNVDRKILFAKPAALCDAPSGASQRAVSSHACAILLHEQDGQTKWEHSVAVTEDRRCPKCKKVVRMTRC